jgi:hypothetical protein
MFAQRHDSFGMLTHYRSQSSTSEPHLRFTNTTDNAKFNVNKPLVHSTAQSFLGMCSGKGRKTTQKQEAYEKKKDIFINI